MNKICCIVCMFFVVLSLPIFGAPQTTEELVLWMGSDSLDFDSFNPNTIKQEERQRIIEKGLTELIKRTKGDVNNEIYHECVVILAKYFSIKNDHRQAFFWLEKAVESGNSDCMLLLFDAHIRGLGTVKDIEEAWKWLVIAAAAGNEYAQNRVQKYDEDYPNCTFIRRAREKAKEWIKQHSDTFYKPYQTYTQD